MPATTSYSVQKAKERVERRISTFQVKWQDVLFIGVTREREDLYCETDL